MKSYEMRVIVYDNFSDEKLLCGFFFYDRTDRPTSKHDQNKIRKKRQKLTYTRLNVMA